MDILELKGVGPKMVQTLNKIGIYSDDDLITHYPFRYNILKKTDLNTLEEDSYIVTDGVIETLPYLVHFKKHMDKMSFKLNTGDRIINVIIFNRGFYKSKLPIGTKITIMGKYDIKHNTCVASELRFGMLPPRPSIEPVYHSTFGLSSKELGKLIEQRLQTSFDVIDYVPDYLNEKYNFLDKEKSIRIVHNPVDIDSLKQARKKLKYEELFMFMLKMSYLKSNKGKEIGLSRAVNYDKVLEFINDLPFELTDDQLSAVKDIYDDFFYLIKTAEINEEVVDMSYTSGSSTANFQGQKPEDGAYIFERKTVDGLFFENN